MNYLEIYKSAKLTRPGREKSPNTIYSYTKNLEFFDQWLRETHSLSIQDDTILQIKPHTLDSYDTYLFSQGFAHTTHNLKLTIIKAFFNYLSKAGYIPENPARVLELVSPPEDEEEKMETARGFTAQEVGMMMENASGCNRLRDRAVIALISGSSMRISEVCSLNMENIHQLASSGYTFVRIKGGRRVRMQVATWAMPYINEYVAEKRSAASPQDPLFITTHNTRLDRKSAWASIAQLERKVGLKTGVHNLRHTAITEVKRATGDIAMAQAIAHHRSSKTTMGYDHTQVSLQPTLDGSALAQVFAGK